MLLPGILHFAKTLAKKIDHLFFLWQFNKFLGRLTWESPSRRRPDPYKMGDDICVLFNKETNNTYGAEVPNKTIKRGLQVLFRVFPRY